MRLYIIAEMPLTFRVSGDFPQKRPKTMPGRFSSNTAQAYSSPKFYEILSNKLSDWTARDIILLGGVYWDADKTSPISDLVELSKSTGIPAKTFEHSITLMICDDNSQPELSPWLLLHQLAEAVILNEDGDPNQHDFWIDTLYPKYAKQLSSMDDGRANPVLETFYKIFKMRSARTRKAADMAAELVTEFLWHKGRLRVNYPPEVPRGVIDAIKEEAESHINGLLDRCTGKLLIRTSPP